MSNPELAICLTKEQWQEAQALYALLSADKDCLAAAIHELLLLRTHRETLLQRLAKVERGLGKEEGDGD